MLINPKLPSEEENHPPQEKPKSKLSQVPPTEERHLPGKAEETGPRTERLPGKEESLPTGENSRKRRVAMEKRNKGDILNSLLRSELSAVETYRHVLERTSAERGTQALKRIAEEHRESVHQLVTQLSDMGIKPTQDAGTWENVAVVAEMAGHPLSDPMAIKALKEGEEQAIVGYRNALSSGALTRELKELIAGNLLPRANTHISMLDKLLDAA